MGVRDAGRSYDFYRGLMGFRIKLSDKTEYMEELEPIVGALVEMRVIMAMNVAGGAAVELVEHTSTRPMEPSRPPCWGDIGYLELGLKAFRLDDLYLDLRSRGVRFLTPVRSMRLSSGGVERYAYLRDPDGLLLQLVEAPGGKRPAVGGVRHVAVGVSDMDRARRFYGGVLGFTETIHEFQGRIHELNEITGGEEMEVLILGHRPLADSVLPLLERPIVKLVHTPGYKGESIYQGRRWGDIGLMEMAFDVIDLPSTTNELISREAELLHPPTRVDMGSGTRGSFSCLKDPDGNILEMVESERVLGLPPRAVKYVLVWLLKAAAALRLL